MKTFTDFAMSSGFAIGVALPISSSSKSVNILEQFSRKCEDRASRFQTEHRTQVVRDAFESPYLRKQKCHISQMHLESPFARLGPNHRVFGPFNIFQASLAPVKNGYQLRKMFLRNGVCRARLSLTTAESRRHEPRRIRSCTRGQFVSHYSSTLLSLPTGEALFVIDHNHSCLCSLLCVRLRSSQSHDKSS